MLINSRQNKNSDASDTTNCYLSPPSRKMKFRYQNLDACNQNQRIISKEQQKTEQRFAVENSIVSAICYLFTVASTHFVVSDPGTPIYCPDIDKILLVPDYLWIWQARK